MVQKHFFDTFSKTKKSNAIFYSQQDSAKVSDNTKSETGLSLNPHVYDKSTTNQNEMEVKAKSV